MSDLLPANPADIPEPVVLRTAVQEIVLAAHGHDFANLLGYDDPEAGAWSGLLRQMRAGGYKAFVQAATTSAWKGISPDWWASADAAAPPVAFEARSGSQPEFEGQPIAIPRRAVDAEIGLYLAAGLAIVVDGGETAGQLAERADLSRTHVKRRKGSDRESVLRWFAAKATVGCAPGCDNWLGYPAAYAKYRADQIRAGKRSVSDSTFKKWGSAFQKGDRV